MARDGTPCRQESSDRRRSPTRPRRRHLGSEFDKDTTNCDITDTISTQNPGAGRRRAATVSSPQYNICPVMEADVKLELFQTSGLCSFDEARPSATPLSHRPPVIASSEGSR